MAGRQPFGKVVAGHGGTYSACPVRLPVLVSATAKTLPETSLAAGTHRHPRCNRRNSLSSFPALLSHVNILPMSRLASLGTPCSIAHQSGAMRRFRRLSISQYLPERKSHAHSSLLPRAPSPCLDCCPVAAQFRVAIARGRRTGMQRCFRPAYGRPRQRSCWEPGRQDPAPYARRAADGVTAAHP
jgi:hypothetical protein